MKRITIKTISALAMATMLCLPGLGISGTAYAQQCMDNGDGTVTDNVTLTMWQMATAGPMNWDQAMSYASGLSLGNHSNWRLPSMDELHGLYNSQCVNLVIMSDDWYWSSTTYGNDTYAEAWRAGIGDGSGGLGNAPMGSHDKSNTYYVRAIRSGQ